MWLLMRHMAVDHPAKKMRMCQHRKRAVARRAWASDGRRLCGGGEGVHCWQMRMGEDVRVRGGHGFDLVGVWCRCSQVGCGGGICR